MLAFQSLVQRLAAHERADEIARLAGRAGIVERQDVRVLQPREQPDLALESLGANRVARVGAEDLDGDGAIVAQVAREEDHGHAAVAELFLE